MKSSEQRPQSDRSWDQAQRDETPTERADRNWTDLLQELRVVQTGVQLLTGFLLTLPFQNRFAQLSDGQQDIYLATVFAAVAATGVLIAPVSIHRLLFRRHARGRMVAIAHRLAMLGTGLLGLAVVGVVLLIVDVLRGLTTGVVSAAVVGVGLISLWLVLPLWLRRVPDSAQVGFDE